MNILKSIELLIVYMYLTANNIRYIEENLRCLMFDDRLSINLMAVRAELTVEDQEKLLQL